MITTVFFDIDGTLVDQKRSQNIAIVSLYKKYGFDSVCDLQAFIAEWDRLTELHYDAYLRRNLSYEDQRQLRILSLFSNFNISIPKSVTPLSIYSEYLRVFEDTWTVFSDVIPTLNSIKNNYKLAIISNGEASQQRQKLEKTGIKKFFNDIVVANNDTRPKPNCDIFQIACNRQRVDYNQCCYVGDNYYTDMIPCKKLGIRGIYINRKHNSIIDPQISIINNLMELSVILKQ